MAEAGRYRDGSRVSAPASEIAAVEEAVELGSKLIILDEEYSSPCIIRRAYPPQDGDLEPLGEMGGTFGTTGISLFMVTGDESAIRRADTVLLMDGFRISRIDVDRLASGTGSVRIVERYPVSKTVSFEKGRKDVSTSAPSVRTVEIGEYKVGVPVAGFFDQGQTRMVADAIAVAKDMMDGSRPLRALCEEALAKVESDDASEGKGMGHARARAVDMAAVLSRHPQMLFVKK